MFQVNEELYPMLELGIGFQSHFTVRENVYIYGSLVALPRREMAERLPKILEFAELTRFADARLENLSTGQQMRLGFAIAVQSIAPIMLVDEVLAVGDLIFKEKCEKTFRRLKAEGTTIVLVTHSNSAVRDYCTRVLVLDGGKIVFDGDPDEGTRYYESVVLHGS